MKRVRISRVRIKKDSNGSQLGNVGKKSHLPKKCMRTVSEDWGYFTILTKKDRKIRSQN